MKKILRILLLASVFIGFCLFLKSTDINESVALIKQLNTNLIFIFCSTLLSYFFGALGWMYCVDSDARPSLLQLFVYRHIGNTISIFNPTNAIAGELFNANKLTGQGVSREIAYQSVLLSRILMILSQLTIFLIVLVWFLLFLSVDFSEKMKYSLFVCFILFVCLFSGLIYLLLKESKSPYPIGEKSKWGKIVCLVKEMRTSLTEYIYQHPRKVLIAFISFSAQWIFSSLEFYFILNFLGYGVGIWGGLFIDTVVLIGKSFVLFIPGQLGAEELLNKFTLLLLGITSAHLWLSVSILRRSRQLFWSVIAFLFYIGIEKYEKTICHKSIVHSTKL